MSLIDVDADAIRCNAVRAPEFFFGKDGGPKTQIGMFKESDL